MKVIMLILIFCVFAFLMITFFLIHEVNEYIIANNFLMEKNKILIEENKVLYANLNDIEKIPKPRGRKSSSTNKKKGE